MPLVCSLLFRCGRLVVVDFLAFIDPGAIGRDGIHGFRHEIARALCRQRHCGPALLQQGVHAAHVAEAVPLPAISASLPTATDSSGIPSGADCCSCAVPSGLTAGACVPCRRPASSGAISEGVSGIGLSCQFQKRERSSFSALLKRPRTASAKTRRWASVPDFLAGSRPAGPGLQKLAPPAGLAHRWPAEDQKIAHMCNGLRVDLAQERQAAMLDAAQEQAEKGRVSPLQQGHRVMQGVGLKVGGQVEWRQRGACGHGIGLELRAQQRDFGGLSIDGQVAAQRHRFADWAAAGIQALEEQRDLDGVLVLAAQNPDAHRAELIETHPAAREVHRVGRIGLAGASGYRLSRAEPRP